MRPALVLTFLALSLPRPSWGQSVESIVVDSKLGIEREAAHWGLTVEQLRRYRQHMQGRGKYHDQTIDPVFALGMATDDENERRQLAELYASQEYERARRFLDFQSLYQAAMHQQHPDGKLVSLDKLFRFLKPRDGSAGAAEDTMSPVPDLLAGDHLLFFAALDCPDCSARFKRQYAQAQVAGIPLHIWFTDRPQAAAVQRWAADNGIPVDAVARGNVTLNVDDGRYRHFTTDSTPVTLHVRNHDVLREID